MVKLMIAEVPLLTDTAVCLGWAGFLGVLGVAFNGVSGGVSGTSKQLTAELRGRDEHRRDSEMHCCSIETQLVGLL